MTKPIAPADLAGAIPATADIPFAPALPALRRDGWTAERQRVFIQVLAETGSVTEAAATVGASPRSAYKLRTRMDGAGFDLAWRCALELASHRLLNIAFERAIHGTPRQLLYRGEVIGEERVPSERLLVHLLRHYGRGRHYSLTPERNTTTPFQTAHRTLSRALDRLADSATAEDMAPLRRDSIA